MQNINNATAAGIQPPQTSNIPFDWMTDYHRTVASIYEYINAMIRI